MRDDAGNSLRLNISQRLPLDDTFLHKMMEYDKRDLALMVAPEGNQTNENLVKYLQVLLLIILNFKGIKKRCNFSFYVRKNVFLFVENLSSLEEGLLF